MTQPLIVDATRNAAITADPAPQTRSEFLSPPRAPLAFRVGIVGHRPNRLAQADLPQLATVVRTVLATVKEEVNAIRREGSWYDSAEPGLRAISPLAEGSDRLFAEQALDLGFQLCCVMPFPQDEYEKDFAAGALEADSLGRFRRLLGLTSTRFELDGCRANSPGAYGAAGRTVLNQSDLLV